MTRFYYVTLKARLGKAARTTILQSLPDTGTNSLVFQLSGIISAYAIVIYVARVFPFHRYGCW
ncbi:hypothetical protein OH492_07660 [Vibrio chagasii]|nr:hypothetical protein [Vibrio chagasii]